MQALHFLQVDAQPAAQRMQHGHCSTCSNEAPPRRSSGVIAMEDEEQQAGGSRCVFAGTGLEALQGLKFNAEQLKLECMLLCLQ